MFFLFFQLCNVIAFIPKLVLSLNIMLESAPEAFQSAQIALFWEPKDPVKFVIGAFTNDASMMVATTIEVVENFSADKIVNMVFNYTSTSPNDCTLYAWIPPAARPCNSFAASESFSVTVTHTSSKSPNRPNATSPSPTSSSPTSSSPTSSSPTSSSPTQSNSTSSVSGTASNVPPKPASHTGVIVGGVLGALALGCLSIYVLIRRRRSNATKPLLRPQDNVALTALPRSSVNWRSISFHEGREIQVAPGVLRDPLEGENIRMREEITALENQVGSIEDPLSEVPIRTEGEIARMREEIAALEDRIRNMEAVCWNSHLSSYRSAQYLLFQ
ncbi:hypothetical protein IW261DRAFT_533567 [Armillaria novae-zelandiae]|uniref:Uncharacterized protein n=1 Tax=Armillaria novae-zelandiae TaxID=153914 RepID=A0AA39T9W7_9AGAR|nr:hypothetical protein IW261DRAFT_533567 [Armillaria novae-zelandiae]